MDRGPQFVSLTPRGATIAALLKEGKSWDEAEAIVDAFVAEVATSARRQTFAENESVEASCGGILMPLDEEGPYAFV